MDIESRLHARLFTKRKCDGFAAGGLAGDNDLMQASCFRPDSKDSYLGPRDNPPPIAPSLLGSWARRRVISLVTILQILSIIVNPSNAAFVDFDNCLGPNIVNTKLLQFTPKVVNAVFNSTAPSHNLNVTVYGNVMGSTIKGFSAPPLNDSYWINPKETEGKILNKSPEDIVTALRATFNVLDYTPYTALTSFCNSILRGECPLAPVETQGRTDPANLSLILPAFSVSHDFYSSYAFTTITAILKVRSGDKDASLLACIEANITPSLGGTLEDILVYVPLVVLILVAVATASGAIFSPWGSTDIFRFTSNYGRDADLLRLVTPGFGDCLQYIQFIVFAGSLSLNYPGFFQPVVSQVSWSALMFNQSFVSGGTGTQSLVDGVYVTNGAYGLDRMSQLIGMTGDQDIWAGMVIWLLAILAAFVILIQLGFICRWGYRHISKTQEEDLRAKNIPFTVGNSIRIIFNYFFLPIVSLSTYQMVVAGHSPAVTVGLAAVLLVACVAFAARLLWLVASTRPRSYLFDDLPTVLLYGPLYNTYSDNAAAFALVPVMLTFIRGIAIGAIQPSGIAQLVLLAICEVILILTLNAFRPFHSPTSMNAFHTFFAVVRLLTILLSVAFVPSLGVRATPRGWIGYVVLLMHGIVLVFGFFLNACQTLVEVIARLSGAGGEEGVEGGAARGLARVFGMRQLSRRNPRRRGQARHSMASEANILGHDSDQKSIQLNGGRSRSMSGSSAILLNRQPGAENRTSMGFEFGGAGARHSNTETGSAPYTPTISGGASAFSYLPGGSQAAGQGGSGGNGIINSKSTDVADPWYRPPRVRRRTNDALPPRARSRGSWASAEWANRRRSQHSPEQDGSPIRMEYQGGEPPSASGRATPLPAHFSASRDRADSNADDHRRSETDYAIREVDFYYGVRGPALSTLPTRRLKTGPADPTGPVSSATGWFKGLFGGKTKDKGKGFEVVRSSKAPPMDLRTQSAQMSVDDQLPYSDERVPERKRDFELSDDGDAIGGGTRHSPDEATLGSVTSEDEEGDRPYFDEDYNQAKLASQISQFPPSLPTIDTGGGIELPSRLASKASSRPTRGTTHKSRRPVEFSRKHPQRGPLDEDFDIDNSLRFSKAAHSPSLIPRRSSTRHNPAYISKASLQPSGTISKRLPFDSRTSSSHGNRPSTGVDSASSSILPNNSIEDKSALGSLAPDLRQDRPPSIGYVQQHRASENIHTASPDKPSLLSSTAEVVDTSNDSHFLQT